MTAEIPTFMINPDGDGTGMFMCPKCKKAHWHMLPEDEEPSHCRAQCANRSYYPNGYYVQRDDL
jgi:hypothetical protein